MKNILRLSACIGAIAACLVLPWLFPRAIPALLPACVLLATVLHELGHLLAYKSLGLAWQRMAFFGLVFEPGKISFDPGRKFFSACCTCRYDPHVPFWRYAVALISGGLTTLLAAILTLCFPSTPFLLCFGIVCAANALFNLLLPFSGDRALLKQIQQERENTV